LSIPSLREVLHLINQIPTATAILIFFVTGSVLILIRDWRASIAALLVQYIVLGLLLARLVRPEIAMTKLLVGLFTCLMFYLSARQASWRRQMNVATDSLRTLLGQRPLSPSAFPPGWTFRLMALLLLAVTAFSVAQTYPISTLPGDISIIIYWLILAGLLILILSEDPLKIGQGLLTVITGFEFWYTTLEDSLLLVGLWGAVSLLLALAIGYLTTVRGVVLEEDF
jgi:hypothetical protein